MSSKRTNLATVLAVLAISGCGGSLVAPDSLDEDPGECGFDMIGHQVLLSGNSAGARPGVVADRGESHRNRSRRRAALQGIPNLNLPRLPFVTAKLGRIDHKHPGGRTE